MNWKIKRTLAETIDKDTYLPDPADVIFYDIEEAIKNCLLYIAEDLGVENGDYDPEMWSGLSWEYHAKSISECLKSGGKYQYANVVWEIVNTTPNK